MFAYCFPGKETNSSNNHPQKVILWIKDPISNLPVGNWWHGEIIPSVPYHSPLGFFCFLFTAFLPCFLPFSLNRNLKTSLVLNLNFNYKSNWNCIKLYVSINCFLMSLLCAPTGSNLKSLYLSSSLFNSKSLTVCMWDRWIKCSVSNETGKVCIPLINEVFPPTSWYAQVWNSLVFTKLCLGLIIVWHNSSIQLTT